MKNPDQTRATTPLEREIAYGDRLRQMTEAELQARDARIAAITQPQRERQPITPPADPDRFIGVIAIAILVLALLAAASFTLQLDPVSRAAMHWIGELENG